MFFMRLIMYLAQHAWALALHLSARGSFPKPLPPEREKELIEAMLGGDTAAGNTLIEHNLRLVVHIAKKYAAPGQDLDDLISIGTIGLIKAVHTFRPEAGRLTTYASRCIENEILMHMRANRKLKNTVLMSDSVGSDSDGNEVQLSDLLGTECDLVPDEVATRMDSEMAIRLIDSVLDARERRVIRLRYALEDGVCHAQRDVGKALGISRSYVSRIEKRALEKLRKHME